MPVEITWRAVPLVSHLHAAHALAHGLPLADSRLAEALSGPAAVLAAEISVANLPADKFWGHLIPQASLIGSRRQLVETAAIKTSGSQARAPVIVPTISAAVAGVETAAAGVLPNLADELSLREGPLREQWEARGPGLIQQIAFLTDEDLLVDSCPVLLVHPALGGGGQAHLAYNSVRLEAVLANPIPELPEVVRLAWLIAQLKLDLPKWGEEIHAARLPHVARFAMLPAVLAAAESVELAQLSPMALQLAIDSWRLTVPAGVDAAALISDWWQTYLDSRPPWRVALQALDQLFG